jgi:hypothetical protein
LRSLTPPLYAADVRFGFGAALLAACSFTIDVERPQCVSESDCDAIGVPGACVEGVCVEGAGGSPGTGGSGGAPPPEWACLGKVEPVVFEPTNVVTRVVTFRGIPNAPVPEVEQVRYCDILDPICSAPLSPTLEEGTDEQGEFLKASLDVQEGSVGFFEITGVDLKPTILFVSPAVAATAEPTEGVTLVPSALFDALVMNAGFQELPDRGTVLILVTDCLGGPAAFSTVGSPQVDDVSRVFYYLNDLPNEDAQSTESNGFAGILNLPAGNATVRTFNPDGVRIGEFTLAIRTGWLSFIAVEPTP